MSVLCSYESDYWFGYMQSCLNNYSSISDVRGCVNYYLGFCSAYDVPPPCENCPPALPCDTVPSFGVDTIWVLQPPDNYFPLDSVQATFFNGMNSGILSTLYPAIMFLAICVVIKIFSHVFRSS